VLVVEQERFKTFEGLERETEKLLSVRLKESELQIARPVYTNAHDMWPV